MAPQLDTTLIDERAVVLANSRRQLVLYYLYENDGEISLEEVSQTIAAVEADFATQSVDSDAVRRVYDTLYMTHVPVLIEHDLVEYDYKEGMLRSTDELEEFLQLSSDSREQQRRWFLYYGVPAAVLTGTVLALYFELVRESVSVLFGLTLGSALLLLCLPLVKYIDTRTILSGE
jgi:hypothetical protein